MTQTERTHTCRIRPYYLRVVMVMPYGTDKTAITYLTLGLN